VNETQTYEELFREMQAAYGRQEKRCNAYRQALARLVALKDGPRDEDYERCKPLAWEQARAALSREKL
jgi:hypothetical protein